MECVNLSRQVWSFIEAVSPRDFRVLVVPDEQFARGVCNGQHQTFCCPPDVVRYLKVAQPTLQREHQAPARNVETSVRGRNHAGVYKWPFHYHVICLANKLKSSRLLAEAIGDAFALVGLEPPAQLPTRWTLQRWELKLDIADMVYRRKALQKEVSTGITARRSLNADSSPQAGFTFFCMREERCCIVDGVLREFSSQSLPVLIFGLHHSKSIDVIQKLRSNCLLVAREHFRP